MKKYKISVVHETKKRIRVRHSALFEPDLDPGYLEALILNIEGVESVRLNIRAQSIVFSYSGKKKTRKSIFMVLENLPHDVFDRMAERDLETDLFNLVSRGVLTLMTPFLPRYVSAPLSYILSASTIGKGVETLVTEGIKVETLDATAVSLSLYRGDYFTANAIGSMLGLGKYIEESSEQKSTQLLKSLLAPERDRVWIEKDGAEFEIDIKKLEVGNIVICGVGEQIPVDGIVDSGEALVNLSSINGESVPVHIKPGDDVISGSVIEEGRIKISARNVGSETSMAKIGKFLEKSIRSKSKSQKQSDKLADSLVPITFALGLGIYTFTRRINRAASVLTVDYSCAIKLATPVVVRMFMYHAAKSGILIKGSEGLDAMARVKTIVMDKTGTLTSGALDVTDIIPFNGFERDELISYAAGAEAHYSHPVANAVVNKAKEMMIPLPKTSEVDFVVAHGVSAYINERRVLVGSRHFISEDEEIDCKDSDEMVKKFRKKGKNILYIAIDGELAGIIALRDDLRPEAGKTLTLLKKAGVEKIVILTGDHEDTAKAIAEKLPQIDEILWDLKPEDKADKIKELKQKAGESYVAFVGDGVNDAPAILSSDVGICMPEGSALAKDSAQIILLEDNLLKIPAAMQTAVLAQKTIKNCFALTVSLNTLILILASSGTLQPVMSAVLHNASTLGILGYASLSGSGSQDSLNIS